MSILLAKTFAATTAVAPAQPVANSTKEQIDESAHVARRSFSRRANPFLARPQAFALFHNWKPSEAA